ncbi:hypothetical protein AVEN_53822-1 [Araneus ventricosus]|uniref:Uncharacterized protein n=1 Tax=Araneus ventricosus TaxID=182803 RepID=A0A4Y2K7W8_ARAVE|nr:hypothetical protein AVEN_53822-1 [Araneus ventricosus]
MSCLAQDGLEVEVLSLPLGIKADGLVASSYEWLPTLQHHLFLHRRSKRLFLCGSKCCFTKEPQQDFLGQPAQQMILSQNLSKARPVQQ